MALLIVAEEETAAGAKAIVRDGAIEVSVCFPVVCFGIFGVTEGSKES